ncbi:hypothetical protein ACLKA6_019234 [Drosophila palustris]
MGTWRLMTRSNRTSLAAGPMPASAAVLLAAVVQLATLAAAAAAAGPSSYGQTIPTVMVVAAAVEPYLAGGWATACIGGCAAGCTSGCAFGYAGGCGAGCWARGCTGGCGAGGCCAGGGTDIWAVGGPAYSFSAAGQRNTTPVDPGHDVGGGVRPASTAWSKIGYVASSRTSVNGRVTKGSAASSSGGGFLLLRRGWKGNRAGARLTLLLLG